MRTTTDSARALPLLLALFLLDPGAPAGGQAGDRILVTITSPDRYRPVFGDIEVAAHVASEVEIERVVLLVDGMAVEELAGQSDTSAYRFEVRLEEGLGEHVFDVVAYGVDGTTGSAHVGTPAMPIDDEVDIRLQQIYVDVSREGERIDDLVASDFTILDERRRQELVTFARGDIPFTAAVLVDASVSMQGAKLSAALAGAETFFDGMHPLDEGRLLVFSDRILHGTPFTTFPRILAAGLDRVSAEGGTSLADHLYLALRQLEARQGRRVVILLSDGVDSHSVLTMQEVLARARRSQAIIYWLRLPYGSAEQAADLPRLSSPWKSSADYAEGVDRLEAIVEESGGRVEPLAAEADFPTLFRDILSELREQYVLGYYPQPAHRDGRWRRVEIETSRPGLTLRTRGGYLDL